jgi:hypothetical protein
LPGNHEVTPSAVPAKHKPYQSGPPLRALDATTSDREKATLGGMRGSRRRCNPYWVGQGDGAEPVQGFLAGLTLEATAAPRPLDEAAPAMPFCFLLPAGFAAEFVVRETALLRGPISELVTESIGDGGRSMADESDPWAGPPASPVTPSPLPAPSNGRLSLELDPMPASPRPDRPRFSVALPKPPRPRPAVPRPALPGAGALPVPGPPTFTKARTCAPASGAP